MHKKFLVIGGAVVAIAAVAFSIPALASSDSYKFLIRGNVTEVDKANKTITVVSTHTSANAQDDLAGELVEFNTSAAKIYKWVNGKKVRVTLGGVPVGHEVVMEGAKRSEGRFNVSKITVNDNAFTVVGILRNHNTSDKTLKVDVSYSSYKSAAVVDKRITFQYAGNTKFYSRTGAEITKEDLGDGDQNIKVVGIVTNGNKWEALKVTDDYAKAK
ncbi:MAG: hypothetical protein AAB649_04540 [Patescibacteria group bacterium]